MKKGFWAVIILLIISITDNIIGLYVLDKSLHYRNYIRYIERVFPNEVCISSPAKISDLQIWIT